MTYKKLEFNGVLARINGGVLLFLLALFFSKVFSEYIGPLILFFITSYLVSNIGSQKFSINKLAVASVLIIGFSPFYLVFRGWIYGSSLTLWDFQIYLTAFLIFSKLIQLKSRKLPLPIKCSKYQLSKLASLSGFFTFLIIQIFLTAKSSGDAVAWISSGDSKNHFVNAYIVNNLGSLLFANFFVQPSGTPAFMALVFSQVQSDLNLVPNYLENLMITYSYVWVALVGVLGIAFAATAEIIWSVFQGKKKSMPVVLIFICGLAPLSSYIIGPVLVDGFFTAIFGVITTVVLLNWFLIIFTENSKNLLQIFIGLGLFVCSLLAWSFIIPFTFALLVVGSRKIIKSRFTNLKFLNAQILIFFLSIASLIHFSEKGQELIFRAKSALTATGAISATNPYLLYAMFAALIVIALTNEKLTQLSNSFVLVSLIGFSSLHLFKLFSNLSFSGWNYYLIKYQWIVFASLSPIFIAIVFVYIYSKILKSTFRRGIALFLSSAIFFLYSETIVSTNRVIPKILRGWENPRALVMNKVLEQTIDRKNPTMFFHYGYGGDARMANFWLTAFADPVEPLKGWNYTIDPTGDVNQLCEVNAYYPTVKVVTSDLKLEEMLLEVCPNEKFIIELVPPII